MVGELFISRSRYWLTKEYPIKLRHCVAALPREAIWARPNDDSNSIGNLLVHLAGNVTEWILGGVGGRPISRYRASEFEQRSGADGRTLLDNLESVLREADTILATLGEADLERTIVIQERETTVLGAIYHVVEHFAMHAGQIVMMTKMHAPGSIRFYEDAGGLAKPLWHRGTGLDEAAH
ncbi:MAG: DinB family protein [Gemmatimonadaceae bacterium]